MQKPTDGVYVERSPDGTTENVFVLLDRKARVWLAFRVQVNEALGSPGLVERAIVYDGVAEA